MWTMRTIAAGLCLALVGTPLPAQETAVKGKITGVDLFKNGLAVVKCEVALAKPGAYVIEEVPQPVHGTYWIESAGPVETLVRMRDVEVPVTETAPGNLQEDLAGKRVTLHLKGANRAPVVGTMLKLKSPKADEPIPPGRFLMLQTGKGRVYVEASEIASIEAEEAGDKVTRRQPRLLLTLGDTRKAETKVTLHYLAHGLSWAPSYRLDITDPKTLALEQHAVIRNEMVGLDGAEVRLISGYPSVQFAHVRSLLSPRTSLMSFFQEIGSNQRFREIDGANNSLSQVSHNYRDNAVQVTLGATPTGEGVDLHYQPIGKRTLAEGDTLALTVSSGKAEYERIVEWLVPDHRDEYGRYDGRNRESDDAWDALKYKNPLTYPMTTGPAMVTAGGLFNGQRMSYWVNSGEETILRVEKALSVRTRAMENERLNKDGSGRDIIWVGGRQYRKTTVEGEVAVSNNRRESISLVIRRRFSGELVEAEGAPKTSLLAEGVYSVNRRNELVWTLPLKGGEQTKMKYSYTVLVLN